MNDQHLLGVCAVNRDHQQCSLYLVVNSETTDLASNLSTNGLVKQLNLIQITTTLVKCMKIWNMIGFVIFTSNKFALYSLRVNFYILFFLYFPFFESWFCTLSRGQIDGSLFVHQILWVFLMVSIGQKYVSFKYNPKIHKWAILNKLRFGWQMNIYNGL